MKCLDNENGFSLVELIIVITLMVIAMGITALNFNNIGYARLESSVEQFIADTRLIQNKSMYSSTKYYRIQWSYDGTRAKYILQDSTDSVNFSDIREVVLGADIEVSIEGDLISSIDPLANADDLIIVFRNTDGSLHKPIPDASANDGVNYSFKNIQSGEVKKVSIMDLTGKVHLDD